MNASLVKLHLEVYMNGTCQAHVEMLRSLVAELFSVTPTTITCALACRQGLALH